MISAHSPPPPPLTLPPPPPPSGDAVTTVRYIEFYAGVGGWTMALEEALHSIQSKLQQEQGLHDHPDPSSSRIEFQCVASLDHSDLCLEVYHYNHSHHRHIGSIVSLSSLSANGNKRINGNGSAHRISSAALDQQPEQQESSWKEKKKKQQKKNDEASRNSSRNNRSTSTGTTTPYKSCRIEEITWQQLIQWDASIWFLSPPCQPHSRQHTNQSKDLDDGRSQSFLHLCTLLEQLYQYDNNNDNNHDQSRNCSSSIALPTMICLENVIGFESSNSCHRFRQVLSMCNYQVGHFILQPTQVLLPNDRPRYYCLAILLPSSLLQPQSESIYQKYFQYEKEAKEIGTCPISKIHTSIVELGIQPVVLQRDENNNDNKNNNNNKPVDDTTKENATIIPAPPPLRLFLDDPLQPRRVVLSTALSSNDQDQEEKQDPQQQQEEDIPRFKVNEEQQQLYLPEKLWKSDAAWCLDICTPNDNRSSCFTSSYGRLAKGTGSVLYVGENKYKSSTIPTTTTTTSIPTPIDSCDYDSTSFSTTTTATTISSLIASADADSTNSHHPYSNVNDQKDYIIRPTQPFTLQESSQRQFDPSWSQGLCRTDIRYFTGMEMTRLYGFPLYFHFPPSITIRQQWKLMGNALNVRVAARLVELGLCATTTVFSEKKKTDEERMMVFTNYKISIV